eukprot:5283154-Prymnesium_polylepis.1
MSTISSRRSDAPPSDSLGDLFENALDRPGSSPVHDEQVKLLSKLCRTRIVRAAVHLDRYMPLGEGKARASLQVNVVFVSLGQQPLAHEHHCAVLEGCDARPLERRPLEKGVEDLLAGGQLNLGDAPFRRPLGEVSMELLPALQPLARHNLTNHRLCEHAVHLGVGQQQ